MNLYDLKEKKPVSVHDKEVANYLTLEGDRYAPLKGHKYMVVDEKTEEANEVLGENLRQQMGEGRTITSPHRYAVRQELKAEKSQVGQFFKSMGNEALLLGLGDIGNQASNPWEELIAEEEKELFGTAKTAGAVVGNVAPFLIPALWGGAAAKMVGKTALQQGIKKALKGGAKGAKYIPSGAAIRASMGSAKKLGEWFAKGVGKPLS